MRRLALTFLLSALGAAGPLSAACRLGVLAELPIRIEGLRAVTTLKINGTETPFAVDTGAFFSVITPGWASQLKLPLAPAPPGFLMIGVGGAMTPQIATVKSLGVLGMTVPNVRFLVDDNEVGGGHTGLVGQNILGIADSEYDFARSTLKLIRPFGCEARSLAYWTKPGESYGEVALEQSPGVLDKSPVGRVFVNGVPMRAVFDTGAGTSLLDRAAARRAKVPFEGDQDVRSGGAERGIGRRVIPTVVAPIEEVRFGADETIKNTRIRVGAVTSGYDMLIGADFFLAHHVYVSKSQHKLYFTYNGGPVFNLASSPAPIAEPGGPASTVVATDAVSLAKEAAVREARRDYIGAKQDLDRAVALAPEVAEYRILRAQALEALGRLPEAAADLDKAVEAAPTDARIRMRRAALRVARGNVDGARDDLAAAEKSLPPQADERLEAASLEEAAEAPRQAIVDLDAWLTYHREDNRRPMALNARCWARVVANTELDKALADCDAAHRAAPKAAAILDSRGWVRLRRGELALAKADFDAALALQPKQAFSLLGRSLIDARLGQADAAKADRAAALALQPNLPAAEKRQGLADLEPKS